MKKMFLVSILMFGMAGISLGADATILQIDGSTTVGPIGDAFAEAFMGMYPSV